MKTIPPGFGVPNGHSGETLSVELYDYFASLASGLLDDPDRRTSRTNTFITFNYDLLLDDALHRAGLTPDYHLPKELILIEGREPSSSACSLLKLHGLRGHSGIYALYKDGLPHYVGKASNLSWRIRHHQNDRLRGKWDSFSLYVVRGDRYVKDVESLLLRIVKPKGSLVSGRFRGAENLRRSLLPKLERYADALSDLRRRK
jgi:hypothetical protein